MVRTPTLDIAYEAHGEPGGSPLVLLGLAPRQHEGGHRAPGRATARTGGGAGDSIAGMVGAGCSAVKGRRRGRGVEGPRLGRGRRAPATASGVSPVLGVSAWGPLGWPPRASAA